MKMNESMELTLHTDTYKLAYYIKYPASHFSNSQSALLMSCVLTEEKMKKIDISHQEREKTAHRTLTNRR